MKFFVSVLSISLLMFALTSCDNQDVSPPWENGDAAGSKSEAPDNRGDNVDAGGNYQQPSTETSASNTTTTTSPSQSGGTTDYTPPPPVNSNTASNNTGTQANQAAGYFGNNLLDQAGNQISKSQLAGKVVGVYFAANWHPASHKVTPKLVNFRNSNQSDFEIVFVSLCNSEAEKSKFIKQTGMRCLTIPGSRTQQASSLARRFGIKAMPQLVILDKNGKTVTTDGLKELNNSGAMAKWKRG